MRSFKGGALAVLVLLSACASSDASAAGSLSPARARRGAHRRMLAADYDAPAKRVLGDYADVDADAALWEAALSPPPPSPRTPYPPSWPPPPRRSPPPAPATPPEAQRASANGAADVRNGTSAAAATNGGGGGASGTTAPPRQSRDAFASADASDESPSPSLPPAPLSRAEFMAKMEAEWNAIGEDDGGDRDASSGHVAVSSPAAALAARDEDADADADEEAATKRAAKPAKKAKKRAAAKQAAVQRADEETDSTAADTDEAERIESPRASSSPAERPSGENEAARDVAASESTESTDESAERSGDSDGSVYKTETAGLSRSVGVDAHTLELPDDDLDATRRNARGVLTGGFAAIAALACVVAVARAALRSVENARPHSSIELGSSSFTRASSSGVPVKYARLERGGSDGDAKRARAAASEKEKARSRSGSVAEPPGAPPRLGGGGTALFGDSGSGRRGKKTSRKTTREEDDFYS